MVENNTNKTKEKYAYCNTMREQTSSKDAVEFVSYFLLTCLQPGC